MVRKVQKGSIINRLVPAVIMLLLGVMVFTPSAMASPMTLTASQPVRMIDGIDAGSSVSVFLIDNSLGYDFGYWTGSGFQDVPTGFANFSGGSLVDFAIQDSGGMVSKLSDGTAEMYFSGEVDASQSQNPQVSDNYYQNLTITWTSGNNDIVVSMSGATDGFSVPDASIMLLLGPSLLILGLLGRKKYRLGLE